MKIIPPFCILALSGFIASGCAEWKVDAMKEPEISQDPVTGNIHYEKGMTLFSTGEPEVSDDPLPDWTDYERETDPLKLPPPD